MVQEPLIIFYVFAELVLPSRRTGVPKQLIQHRSRHRCEWQEEEIEQKKKKQTKESESNPKAPH
jgi:hypothetical protein